MQISYRQGFSQLAGVVLHAIRGDYASAANFATVPISPEVQSLVKLALDRSQLEADAFSLFELLMNDVVCYFEDSCSSKPPRSSASGEPEQGSRLFQILARHSQMLKGTYAVGVLKSLLDQFDSSFAFLSSARSWCRNGL